MLLTIESGKVHKGLLLTGFREIVPESMQKPKLSNFFSHQIAVVAAADLCAQNSGAGPSNRLAGAMPATRRFVVPPKMVVGVSVSRIQ